MPTRAEQPPSREDASGGGAAVPVLTIVWHPCAHRTGERLVLAPLTVGEPVLLSRRAPDFVRPENDRGEPLADPSISRTPIRFAPTPGGGVEIMAPAAGPRLATVDGPTQHVVLDREAIAQGVPLTLADRVVLLLHFAPLTGASGPDLGMVGYSGGIQRVREHIRRVADLPVPVLIRGETGTGKELVAKAIHALSPRRKGPFRPVNLGAMEKNLAPAQLFGAKEGGFTGAKNTPGHFELAQGGTLFLDELGELPAEVQPMLLRVLETSQVQPVGATAPVNVDVRVLAATDANLEGQIAQGRFKQPLLHRLAGYILRIPPLRERREDIGPLIYHFARASLAAFGAEHRLMNIDPSADPWLPSALVMKLLCKPWSGNIRHLRNAVAGLVIANRERETIAADSEIDDDLDVEVMSNPPRSMPALDPAPVSGPGSSPPFPRSSLPPAPISAGGPRKRPSDVTEAALRAALQAADWEPNTAAKQLGLPRPSIYDQCRRWGIRLAGDLTDDEIERSFHEHHGDLDAVTASLRVSKHALQRRLRERGLIGRRKGPAR